MAYKHWLLNKPLCPLRLGALSLLLTVAIWATPDVLSDPGPRHIHLSWEDNPASSITVTWRTDDVSQSIVEYGPSEILGKNATSTPGKIHQVSLEGLLSETRYFYRCGDGRSWSEVHSFETGPGDPSERYCFAAYGDDRSNFDVRRSIGTDILGMDADFVINTGDLVSEGTVQTQWDLWFESLKELLARKVVMPTIGNHEENSPLYFDQFALPGSEEWYSFDYGNAHFVALSTETTLTGQQLEWLQDDLSSCNSTWKFVFLHRPMYSSGYHGSDLSVRRTWEDTLVSNRVDLVFCGHNHIYERIRPMGSVSGGHGVIHIVTGGGGAGLHELGAVIQPWTEVAVSEHHYVLVTVSGESLLLEARLPDGTIFDRLEIQKMDLPDLVVESITTEPRYPEPTAGANVTAIVSNRGPGAAAAGSLARFTVNGETLGDIVIGPLGPGETATIQAGWLPQESGPANIQVQVDCLCLIDEGLKENNNQLSLNTNISVPRPDLKLVSLTCSPAVPGPLDEIKLSATVKNTGNADSDPFELEFAIRDRDKVYEHQRMNIKSLTPGETVDTETAWLTLEGEWRAVFEADPDNLIDEILESNNAADLAIHIDDLVGVGPAHLPRGIDEHEPTVIYYNASHSDIAGSTTCYLVWGVNGWQRPPTNLATSRTLALSRYFETPMERFGQDVWVCLLPPDSQIHTLELRFTDQAVIPKAVDDNGGQGWVILGKPWAEDRLEELSKATLDASNAGLEVSNELKLARDAEENLVIGDYYGLNQTIGETITELRHRECQSIIQKASLKYEEAVTMGLDVGRALIYLGGAREELGKGNLQPAKNLALNALDIVNDAQNEIPQAVTVAFLLLLLAAGMLPEYNMRLRHTACSGKNHRV